MVDNKKDSNPKDALGIKKVPLHAVPVKPLLEVGLAMMEGGRKYGTHNYRSIGVRMSTYYNAAMRHLMAWWEGENIDPDSGVPHIIKAIACLFVVQDSIYMGNCEDDRPIQYPIGIDMEAFNTIAADLITKYPECAKPFIHTPQLEDRPNEIVPGELKSEPKPSTKFKNADKVKITLRESAPSGLREECKEVNFCGEYIKLNSMPGQDQDQITHRVWLGTSKRYDFFTDELTLMEG